MLLPAIFYTCWDSWFTKKGVWSFSPDHITGIHIGNLPLEEVLFFFVIPYCCVFIYECIICYFPKLTTNPLSDSIFRLTGALLFVAAFFFREKDYTFYTFLFCSLAFLLFGLFRSRFWYVNLTAFLLSYVIILAPFLLVNGFLTAIPVVLYNDAANLGVRIHTIPVEDIIYGMLLFFMNIIGYERERSVSKRKAVKGAL